MGDDVKQVALDEVTDEGTAPVNNGDGPELDVILDIPVRISMEVGSTQIPIRNLLQLNQGSVVELDRLAGEPLDVKKRLASLENGWGRNITAQGIKKRSKKKEKQDREKRIQ